MKEPPPGTADRIAKMTIGNIYPLYLTKIERKGRTEKELEEVIGWLTGYDAAELAALVEADVDLGTFFGECRLHPNARLITGTICGYRVEEIQDPLIRRCRYLDKLVDELAKGRKMEKILRTEP